MADVVLHLTPDQATELGALLSQARYGVGGGAKLLAIEAVYQKLVAALRTVEGG